MLANRVRKNARHLGKWAKREHVTCWRVYDRDIPEVPITVDTYEGALVDQRLPPRAPRSATAATRGSTTRWPRRRGALERDRGVRQAARAAGAPPRGPPVRAARGRARRVAHRAARAATSSASTSATTSTPACSSITASRARGSRAEPARTMLNLFAYTGSFTVYAAAAGMQTTTVDLSKTYLEWAGENLALNRLDRRARPRRRPRVPRRGAPRAAGAGTSRSSIRRRSRTRSAWTTRGTSSAITRRCSTTSLAVRGRDLVLDEPAAVQARAGGVGALEIEDRTRATIPPDFRDQKVHHAYRLQRKQRVVP